MMQHDSQLNQRWKIKFVLLFLVIIPSFTGGPEFIEKSFLLFGWMGEQYSGVSDFKLLYIVIVAVAVSVLTSAKVYSAGVISAILISVSLVLFGSLVSWIMELINSSNANHIQKYAPFYLGRLINMLSVVPIAIGLVASIPITRMENAYIRKESMSSFSLKLLLISRIVNHILNDVIPKIIVSLREERTRGTASELSISNIISTCVNTKDSTLKATIKDSLVKLTYLVVITIIASIQFIPMWSVEISKLAKAK